MTTCQTEGCEKPAVARGICDTEYRRLRRGEGLGELRYNYLQDPYWKMVSFGFDRVGECLLSRSNRASHGYVSFSVGGERLYAHKVSYEKWHGPAPNGLNIDHVCHNEAAERGECDGGDTCRHRACVNPAHLRAVTQRQNVLSSPLSPSSRQSRWTECPQGHPFDEQNTYVRPNGKRECRRCIRTRRKAYA